MKEAKFQAIVTSTTEWPRGSNKKKTYILIQHIIKMGQINPEGRGRYIYGS